jgi:hypothetical protein
MATVPTQDRVVGRTARKGRGVATPAPTQTGPQAHGLAVSDPISKGMEARGARKRTVAAGAEVGSPMVATALRTAVLGRATDMGLIGAELQQVGARLPKQLLIQAKKRTGIDSTTDLIEFALANVAVEDNFPQAFIAARGKLDPDRDIGF